MSVPAAVLLLLFLSAQAIVAASVPFVGCPSSGQVSRLAAPSGTDKVVSTSLSDATKLAYYESPDSLGVLAPRGWYCQGASGSSGEVLFLSPKPIQSDSSGWHGLEDAAIEYYRISGDASGRYEIARIIAHVFPAYRVFARQILDQIDLPFPSGPFPSDHLVYKSETIVEYKTPARMDGLGNFDSWLGKGDAPISGVAILAIDPEDPVRKDPHLALLSIRLPRNLERLIPVMVHYLEKNAELSK